MNMKNRRSVLFLTLVVVILLAFSNALQVSAASETDPPPDEYDWITGPGSVSLDGKATLAVPKSHSYLDKANTQRSILNSDGKPNGNEIGSLTSKAQTEMKKNSLPPRERTCKKQMNSSMLIKMNYPTTANLHIHLTLINQINDNLC
jgi:hypothetical protein